jgi:hypothetical protein
MKRVSLPMPRGSAARARPGPGGEQSKEITVPLYYDDGKVN